MESVYVSLLLGAPPLFICTGMILSFRGLRSNWKSFLLWEAAPFLWALFFFTLIAVINWDYESKMIVPQKFSDHVDSFLGLILLGMSLASTLLAGVYLYTIRLLVSLIKAAPDRWYLRIPLAFLGISALLLTLFSVGTVILGPAAITMKEQMVTHPETSP